MPKKDITLNGKKYVLPEYISLTTLRGEYRFVLTWYECGHKKRKYFQYTVAGLNAAKSLAVEKNHERKQYGTNFGNITDDEKRAIEEYRTYIRDCEFNGIKPKTMFNIITEILKSVQATTPTFKFITDVYYQSFIKKSFSSIYVETTSGALDKLSEFFGDRQIHTLNEVDFEDFMATIPSRKGELSYSAKVKYLNVAKAVLEFAIQRKIIDAEYNFLKNLSIEKPKRVEPTVLSVHEAKRLMSTIKNTPSLYKYIPMVVLGLFCGIRNQERCRLKYSDIYVGGRNEIFLSCEVTKTATDRIIYPAENVKRWLEFARLNGVDMSNDGYICIGETEKDRVIFSAMFHKELKKHGIVLPKNVFRHSAASYMCELQGFTATSTQLGHAEAILRKHYRRALTKNDAVEFFNITPENS